MTPAIVLGSAWRPRGELARLQRLLPALNAQYAALAITLPPETPPALLSELKALPGVHPVLTPAWPAGRHLALQTALSCSPADWVHYADLDRLLRWVETRPAEWRAALTAIPGYDCLVMGRTSAAYATHPRALFETEAISNAVVSHFLGQAMDVSAGSKGFSRPAAQVLVERTRPEHALGADATWPILLQRLGYRLGYLAVDGLDWESADRYQPAAASGDTQSQAAARQDADPSAWAMRVRVAQEIVACAFEAYQHDLS